MSEQELECDDSVVDRCSGRMVLKPGPGEIDYYRRVRKCAGCGTIFATAEVSERLLDELVALRNGQSETRRRRSTVIAHTNAAEYSLREVRKTLRR